MRRVIFREKLLQPCPAKQAGAGVFDALLLHSGTGTAELALTLGMLHFHDLQPCQCLCSHETESSVLPDVNANKKIGGRGGGGRNGKKGQWLSCAFPESSGEKASGQPLVAALSV